MSSKVVLKHLLREIGLYEIENEKQYKASFFKYDKNDNFILIELNSKNVLVNGVKYDYSNYTNNQLVDMIMVM